MSREKEAICLSHCLKGQILICQIHRSNDDNITDEFAFYVYNNDQRIHIQWYSKSPILEFDTGGVSGYYRVMAFVKDSQGSINNKKTVPIFANPVGISSEEMVNISGKAGAYLLKGNSWSYPALYYPSAEKKLFVLMPSAVDREKYSLPAFSRWSWATHFPGDVVCVADPTLELHADLRLGWCIGDSDNCATSDLARLIVRLAEVRAIPHEKIVIYGSSAGGFAALALSACIEGSTAVAINAQTDALSYDVSDQVSLVRQVCFDSMTDLAIRDSFLNRVDMIARWSKVKLSRAFLVQNTLDHHHYDVHFKPFWNFLGGVSCFGFSSAGRHNAWVYQDEGGHVAETLEMAKEIIKKLDFSAA